MLNKPRILLTVAMLVTAFVGTTAQAAAPATAPSFKSCPQFFPGAAPAVPNLDIKKPRELCFNEFAVLYSGVTKTPIYTAERLNREKLLAAKHIPRVNKFYEEARLPFADRAQLRDYKATDAAGLRYDRGHYAPAGDMSTVEGKAQSFSLANMGPQLPQFNRGAWSDIEEATRKYILRAKGDVFVNTGSVNAVGSIGPNRVGIPGAMYKLVYDYTTKKSWVHWLDHTEKARVGKPISVEEWERRTGMQYRNVLDSL